jgi:hypothetical protein
MQRQGIPDEPSERPCFSEEQRENDVMGCLLIGQAWPWSVDEIAREIGDRIEAVDAINRLERTGLVHRLGKFVFPTRTARRASELEIGVA